MRDCGSETFRNKYGGCSSMVEYATVVYRFFLEKRASRKVEKLSFLSGDRQQDRTRETCVRFTPSAFNVFIGQVRFPVGMTFSKGLTPSAFNVFIGQVRFPVGMTFSKGLTPSALKCESVSPILYSQNAFAKNEIIVAVQDKSKSVLLAPSSPSAYKSTNPIPYSQFFISRSITW